MSNKKTVYKHVQWEKVVKNWFIWHYYCYYYGAVMFTPVYRLHNNYVIFMTSCYNTIIHSVNLVIWLPKVLVALC